MTNSVNSFQDLGTLLGNMLNQADAYNEQPERPTTPKKPSRYQRMKVQLDFNIRKFTNHRYVGKGVKAVSIRKFNIKPEVK